MTDRADLGIDLEAALRRGEVEVAERTVEAPMLCRRCRCLLLGGGRCGHRTSHERCRQELTQRAHHAFSIGLAVAPEGIGPPPPMTGRLMLSGSGSGRSSLPRIGRITRKCR